MPRYPGLNFYAAGRTDIRGVTTYTSGGPPPKKKIKGDQPTVPLFPTGRQNIKNPSAL